LPIKAISKNYKSVWRVFTEICEVNTQNIIKRKSGPSKTHFFEQPAKARVSRKSQTVDQITTLTHLSAKEELNLNEGICIKVQNQNSKSGGGNRTKLPSFVTQVIMVLKIPSREIRDLKEYIGVNHSYPYTGLYVMLTRCDIYKRAWMQRPCRT
jgi:hypothetical protein